MKDNIYKYAMKHIAANRINHTMGVIKAAKWLAISNNLNLDANKLETAALLHDITKHFTPKEQINLCIKYGAMSEINLDIPKTFHQVTGAIIAKYDLFIDDPDILNAIRYHTTGRENMSLYEKVIFIADFIEDGRTYEGVEEIRKAAAKGLDEVLITGFSFTIEELAKEKK
ncbi:MAG: bis(5'-nucleosyl)-tetraphosphatase (symmetrical) YqeK [Clostridia bacterium]